MFKGLDLPNTLYHSPLYRGECKIIVAPGMVNFRKSPLIGEKAKLLSLAVDTGVDIPKFNVLSSAAFALFARTNNLQGKIADLVNKTYKKKERIKRLSELYSLIAFCPLPQETQEKVLSLLESSEKSLAVRLSYYSELAPYRQPRFFRINIKTKDSLYRCIKKCWATLFSELFFHPQAIRNNGFTAGVILQDSVNSHISGVFYNQSQDSGEENLSVIKWCRGLGETIKKERENVSYEKIIRGDKRCEIVKSHAGTQEAYYAFSEKSEEYTLLSIKNKKIPELKEEHRKRIISWGKRLKESFGSSFSFTWTVSGEKLFLLGIKTRVDSGEYRDKTSSLKTFPGERIWTNRAVSEVFQSPLSPMGWSIWQPVLEKVCKKKLLRTLGIKRSYTKKYRWFRLINSHPYTDSFLLAKANTLNLNERNRASTDIRALILASISFSYNALFLPSVRSFQENIRSFIKRDRADAIKNKSQAQLLNMLAKTSRSLEKFISIYSYTVLSTGVFLWLLERYLKAVYGNHYKKLLFGLLVQKENSIHEKFRRDLEEVSLLLWSSEKFQAFLKNHKKRVFQEILRENPMGMPFLRGCFRFNQKYGWISNSVDVEDKTLDENPKLLFDLCTVFQEQKGEIKKQRHRARLRHKRKKRYIRLITEKKSLKMFNILVFFLLRKSETGLFCVEEHCVSFQKFLKHIRNISLELGERLTENGILERREDIFFLELSEIEELLTEKTTIGPRIPAQRREKLSSDKRKYTFQNYIEHGKSLSPITKGERRALIYFGKGINGGKATGSLAIIGPGEKPKELAGKIVLSRTLDRQWDFEILGVKGIITEADSIFSHTAFIARQYCVPSVSGIPELSQELRNGDVVYLDANSGTVEVLARSMEA